MVKFGAVFKKWWNGPHKGFVRYAVGITAIALVYATFFQCRQSCGLGQGLS